MNKGMHINDALLQGKILEMSVLSFLHQEIYSNFDNLMALIKIKQPNLSRLLKRMVNKRLLEKHSLTLDTCKISLWGITDKGIHLVGDSDHAPMHCFTPSRISLVTLNHTLMNQRVFIALKHLNWTGWTNADRHTFKKMYPISHRPDAIVSPPSGGMVAIETELTLKTPIRYRSIMKSHIQAKSKGFWGHVIYVVRDEEYKKMLNRRFDNIKFIPFDNSRHDFEKYRSMVSIFTLAEVSQLTQSN